MRLNSLFLIFCAVCCWLPAQSALPGFSQTVSPDAPVLIAKNPAATKAFKADPVIARELFKQGLMAFTREDSEKNAWASLLKSNDVVGIKVFTAPGRNSGTRLASAAAMIQSLIAGGISPSRIIVWDKRLSDLAEAGYLELRDRYKVEVAGAIDSGFGTNFVYESPLLGNLVWGDYEFGRKGEGVGRKSFVTKLLSERITKTIVLSPLLNHNIAGITGSILSLGMGSVDNTIRFEIMGDRLATAAPEIFALEPLVDKAVLYVLDGLIGQYLGEERTLLHYSVQLGEFWFSKDPVALDVLGIEEMKSFRKAAGIQEPKHRLDIYQNAALLELGTADIKKIRAVRLSF